MYKCISVRETGGSGWEELNLELFHPLYARPLTNYPVTESKEDTKPR